MFPANDHAQETMKNIEMFNAVYVEVYDWHNQVQFQNLRETLNIQKADQKRIVKSVQIMLVIRQKR